MSFTRKETKLAPINIGEAEVHRIKDLNRSTVDLTRKLISDILELDAVKAKIGPDGPVTFLSALDTFAEPWIEDIGRGGAVGAKEVSAVADNLTITD